LARVFEYKYREHLWARLDDLGFQLPNIQSHRGYCLGGARENSIESIEQAFEAGYRMVEIDLRLRQDGVVVVCHDRIFDSTPTDDFPTLEKVLDVLKSDCYFNLEIKNESRLNYGLERALIKLLRSHPKRRQVMFSGFNPGSLLLMWLFLPFAPRALSVNQSDSYGNAFFLKEMWFLRVANPHFIDVCIDDLASYEEVPAERKVVWTVNDIVAAKRLINSNQARSIVSDSILPSDLGPSDLGV
jgi:glycerophosphoryl diester phosphodiesterase